MVTAYAFADLVRELGERDGAGDHVLDRLARTANSAPPQETWTMPSLSASANPLHGGDDRTATTCS